MKVNDTDVKRIIIAAADETDGDHQDLPGVATVHKTKLPKKFKVLMHNDDYTTMEFVVLVLKKFFHKNFDEAQVIMLQVHNDGVGICGVYSHEVAETKASKVNRYARENGHPLKCTIEEE